MRFPCPNCGKLIEADLVWRRQQTRCPACHAPLVAPSPPLVKKLVLQKFLVIAGSLGLFLVAGIFTFWYWAVHVPAVQKVAKARLEAEARKANEETTRLRTEKEKSKQAQLEAERQVLTVALQLAIGFKNDGEWTNVVVALEKPLKVPGTADHPNREAAESLLSQARAEIKKRAEAAVAKMEAGLQASAREEKTPKISEPLVKANDDKEHAVKRDVETIQCTKEIIAFDPNEPSHRIGSFHPQSTLEVEEFMKAARMYRVKFKAPDGTEVHALCRPDDLGKEISESSLRKIIFAPLTLKGDILTITYSWQEAGELADFEITGTPPANPSGTLELGSGCVATHKVRFLETFSLDTQIALGNRNGEHVASSSGLKVFCSNYNAWSVNLSDDRRLITSEVFDKNYNSPSEPKRFLKLNLILNSGIASLAWDKAKIGGAFSSSFGNLILGGAPGETNFESWLFRERSTPIGPRKRLQRRNKSPKICF